MKRKFCLLCVVAVLMSGCGVQKENIASRATQIPVEKQNE